MDRLRQRADFLAAAQGARQSGPGFVVQERQRGDSGTVRVGFTITKKIGTATERNRIRRRLRALVACADVEAMKPATDYVLIGRRAALSRAFMAMQDDLQGALRRLGRIKRPDRSSTSHTARNEI